MKFSEGDLVIVTNKKTKIRGLWELQIAPFVVLRSLDADRSTKVSCFTKKLERFWIPNLSCGLIIEGDTYLIRAVDGCDNIEEAVFFLHNGRYARTFSNSELIEKVINIVYEKAIY